MKVSVVLSTYNGSSFIIEQLESLRCQSYPVDEVLISDDCSKDDTAEVIRNYIETNKLSNWHFSVNENNLGWRKNFMLLLWKAKGEVIFTCDQDDIWNEDKVARMVSVMEKHNEISMLACKYTEFYEDGTEVICPKRVKSGIHKVSATNNIFKVPFPGCAYAIRDRLAKMSKDFWRESFPHDAILWRLSLLDNSLYVLGESLFRMRKHSQSAYTVESRMLKKKSTKREWLDYGVETVNVLDKFTEKYTENSGKNKRIIEKNKKWLSLRIEFYDNRSIIAGIKLLRYLDCYPALKQYLGDWYLIFVKH